MSKNTMNTSKTRPNYIDPKDPRALAWDEKQEHAADLARHLRRRSKEICALNGCTEDEHNCESYAYVRHDMKLLDICISDYFQGCSAPHAAISLPFDGSAEDLLNDVQEQCADLSED